jgi:serine phosphatase RsbU (regulator of sigma subunit)
LEGHDENWITGNERRVSYSNLEPGAYKFHVKAVNNEGVWSPESLSVSIIINQPWWNTLSAYLAYVVIFLGTLMGVRHFELTRRKENENKRLLELENKRKTRELEEARQLQLSMLPKQIPILPNIDIAVYMKTATEVGGDYYDFHVGIDGTLTVVIGDATGHGMKAGTMVTTTKSLFRVLAPNPDVTGTFNEMTKCIKEMEMAKLSMCMTLAKFTNGSMIISTAGMPPAYYFNNSSGEVKELLTEGMPLGTFDNFPYETKEVKISKGDTILLLSDGMPELQNENGEMFGYEKLNEKFGEIARNKPEEIITELKETAASWVNDKDPGDDVTFVVIKVK